MKKQNAPLAGKGESAEAQANSKHFTGRQQRLLTALLNAPVSREEADRLCHASNAPDVVFRLRNRGFDIQTSLVPCVSYDGRPSRYGLYWLKPADKPVIRRLLREVAK